MIAPLFKAAALALALLLPPAQAAQPVPEKTVSFRFDAVPVKLLAAVVFSDLLRRPYVLADDITDKRVTLELNGVPVSAVPAVMATVLHNSGVHILEREGVIFLTPSAASEVVYYLPKHRPASELLEAVRQAFPTLPATSGTMSPPGLAAPGADAQAPALNGPGGEAPPQNSTLTKSPAKGQPLPGLDVVVLSLPPRDAALARDLLAVLDQPSQQLYIRAVAYDVRLGQDSGTSLDLALSLFGDKLGLSLGSGGVVQAGASALTFANQTIDAVAKVLDKDNRFKSISRPSVRVRSGGSARFSVGQEVPTLGAVTSNNSGQQQSIVYRQSGIIFDVRPVLRSEYVDLDLVQTISAFQRTETSGLDSPTLTKRELTSTLSVRPGEVVVIAGLDADDDSGSEMTLFGLTLGKSSQSTKSQTLLVLEIQRI